MFINTSDCVIFYNVYLISTPYGSCRPPLCLSVPGSRSQSPVYEERCPESRGQSLGFCLYFDALGDYCGAPASGDSILASAEWILESGDSILVCGEWIMASGEWILVSGD